MAKAVHTRHKLDESAEIPDRYYLTIVIDFAYLRGCCQCLYYFFGLEVIVAANTTDKDSAVVFDFNSGFGLLLNTLNHLAARTNDFANQLGVNLNADKFRCILAELGSGAVYCTVHYVEDLQPCDARLFKGLHNNILSESFGFDVKLYRGDAVFSTCHLEVHLSEVVFLAHNIG